MRDPDLSASITIASNISTVTGSFLTAGFASDCCRPSMTKGLTEGKLKPALACTRDTASHASSTAALELVSSSRCCRYKAKRWGFAETDSRPLELSQVLHFQKAHSNAYKLFINFRTVLYSSAFVKKLFNSNRKLF